jgi:replicative DNA helicase
MTQNTHITVNEGGISSGFTQLDRITGGWQPSNLIVIASRPSMGKTAFALSMARNMAIDMGYGVAFFSLEMSAQYLLTRMIVAETEFDGDRIRPDNLAEEVKSQLDAQTAKLANAPIYIDDTPALSALEIGVACERLVQQHGIHVAIIDYFQRMGDYHCCAEDANIIRSLKATAKKLNIPVIVFSQLYRVFKRSERRKPPQLADLMCSDAIEQNADIVMFIHRPEQDGFTEDCEGNDLRGYAEITVARHRNGALGSVGLRFKKEFAKFVTIE